MIEINLIPDVKQQLLKAQRIRNVVISSSIIVSLVAVGIVVLLVVYMLVVQNARSAYLDGQIDKKYTELSKNDDLSKMITIQNQLSTISSLNDQKVLSSRTFDVVSAITPSDDTSIAFSQIDVTPNVEGASTDETDTTTTAASGDAGGSIKLEGQIASYDLLEAFKKRIANTSFEHTEDGKTTLIPIASNISTSDISYGEDTDGAKVLRFTISFDYPTELLASASANQPLVFKLSVDGNVTDSYLGIPRFVERTTTGEDE